LGYFLEIFLLNLIAGPNNNIFSSVPLSELDADAAQRALGKWQEQTARATNEKDKAIARIGLEAATAIVQALALSK
jgi:hypothetical protein